MSVCPLDYSKLYECISMKFFGGVGTGHEAVDWILVAIRIRNFFKGLLNQCCGSYERLRIKHDDRLQRFHLPELISNE